MRVARTLYGLLVLSAVVVGQLAASELRSLYDAHQWPELRDRLGHASGPPLYSGAVAAAFNEARTAEKILRSVIRRDPRSEDARGAYDILAHLYLDLGLYQRFHTAMEQKWAAFPDGETPSRERREYAAFLGLPDQKIVKRARSVLRHAGDLWIPFTINGMPVKFFLDTGAGISAISESEAGRLGLVFEDASSSIGSSTGKRTGMRTAIARQVDIANIHLRDVSFIVLPDDQEPWVHLTEGRRGLLGVPVLIAFGALQWRRDGTLELNPNSSRTGRNANLYFAEDHLAAQVAIRGRELSATLDTGAVTTDLYAGLTKSIPALLQEGTGKTATEVRGVAGKELFESITVPELTIGLEGLDTVLRPAHVLLKQLGPSYCVGNLGLDLLRQAESFTIDFDAMRLELRRKP